MDGIGHGIEIRCISEQQASDRQVIYPCFDTPTHPSEESGSEGSGVDVPR